LINHPAWEVLGGAVEAIESQLTNLDEFHEVHAHLSETGSVFAPEEVMQRYDRTLDQLYEIDDYCAAFFLVLQTRLSAITSAACNVYTRAKYGDKIVSVAIPKGEKLLAKSPPAWNIWQTANYVKHHEEWTFPLNEHQAAKTFAVLCELGVAEQVDEPLRYRTDWVASECARAITKQQAVAMAMKELVHVCERFGAELLDEVRDTFDPYENEIEARRAQAAEDFNNLRIEHSS
jgi:hypothetical protein